MVPYLGIDGGGTGCRAAIADGCGTILGRGDAGPANITSDPAGARDNILAAARQALGEAVGQSEAESEITQIIAGLGLAGANAAGAAGRLRLDLPFAQTRIETDAVAAAKGALAGADGIVAAMGTGSVFAVQKQGAISCYGGWGLVLGDEGSGAYLGRAALAQALRAWDGFVPMTPLLQSLLDEHGGASGVVAFAQAARAADFARLAPRIACGDDAAAATLWSQSVDHVAAVLSRLGQSDALPVTFIGGLGPAYSAALPHVAQAPAKGTALDGALLLAREAA